AEIGADQTSVLPGLAAVDRNFNARGGAHAAHRHTLDLHPTRSRRSRLGRWRVDPRLDVHFPYGGLARVAFLSRRRNPVAGLLYRRVGLLRGEREALDVLDVV